MGLKPVSGGCNNTSCKNVFRESESLKSEKRRASAPLSAARLQVYTYTSLKLNKDLSVRKYVRLCMRCLLLDYLPVAVHYCYSSSLPITHILLWIRLVPESSTLLFHDDGYRATGCWHLCSQSGTKPATLHSTLVTYSSYIASLLLLPCFFFHPLS